MLTFSLTSMPLASPGSLTLAVQPRPYQRQQLLGVNRLGDVVRSPRFQALLAVALHGLGGEGDDRQLPELMLAADAAHGLVAVHFGIMTSISTSDRSSVLSTSLIAS